MNVEEANKINEAFAKEFGLEYQPAGFCGFGRPCVGFALNHRWIEYDPIDWKSEDYAPIIDSGNVEAPEGVTAYHKSNYLCVLKTECDTALVKSLAGIMVPFTAKDDEELDVKIKEIEAMPDPEVPEESTNRAIVELAVWVNALRERGTISIVEFDTGAEELQAVLDGGTTAHAIVVK